MGSDYLLVIGTLLLGNFKTMVFGILCIISACFMKKRKTIKEKKHIYYEDGSF